MRGPGIPANSSSAVPATMVDLAPTLLALAGIQNTTVSLDGVDLLDSAAPPHRRFLVEYRWAVKAVWCSAKLVWCSGEGGEGVDRACSQWNTGEFSWCKAELDCKCQVRRAAGQGTVGLSTTGHIQQHLHLPALLHSRGREHVLPVRGL